MRPLGEAYEKLNSCPGCGVIYNPTDRREQDLAEHLYPKQRRLADSSLVLWGLHRPPVLRALFVDQSRQLDTNQHQRNRSGRLRHERHPDY